MGGADLNAMVSGGNGNIAIMLQVNRPTLAIAFDNAVGVLVLVADIGVVEAQPGTKIGNLVASDPGAEGAPRELNVVILHGKFSAVLEIEGMSFLAK
jgi:hypothetical protein